MVRSTGVSINSIHQKCCFTSATGIPLPEPEKVIELIPSKENQSEIYDKPASEELEDEDEDYTDDERTWVSLFNC